MTLEKGKKEAIPKKINKGNE